MAREPDEEGKQGEWKEGGDEEEGEEEQGGDAVVGENERGDGKGRSR